jgi:predicted nucleic acid-binding protein
LILVDTTVWIDLFADRDTIGTRKLKKAIEDEEDLCTCGLVLTEVLQGIRNDSDFRKTLIALQGLLYLPVPQETYLRAAEIYRACRKKGVTIRKTNDCIIAAICIDNTAFLLHNDHDFVAIAKHAALQTI